MSDRLAVRRESFQPLLTQESSRLRREEVCLTVRKSRKDENLAKRRALRSAPPEARGPDVRGGEDTGHLAILSPGGTSWHTHPLETAPAVTEADIPSLVANLLGASDMHAALAPARGLRLLAGSDAPPIDAILAVGGGNAAVERLASFLSDAARGGGGDEEALRAVQLEAAWALTNVAATDRADAVVASGALAHLAALIGSGSGAPPELRHQCVWLLGNIAGDRQELRLRAIGSGALFPLLELICALMSSPDWKLEHLRTAMWTLANLCRKCSERCAPTRAPPRGPNNPRPCFV